MADKVYSLKRKKDTEELHLFEAIMAVDKKNCTPNTKSICKEMLTTESDQNNFTCLYEADARKKCADIGRPVCGTCVSHLYESY